MDSRRKPGDETEPGSEQTGESVCRDCAGTGQVNGARCIACDGTGTVTVIVGDA
jgi:DnaJ-class molecular chaperone